MRKLIIDTDAGSDDAVAKRPALQPETAERQPLLYFFNNRNIK
ncbi:hypothetical protein PAE9249_02778 [Paenibacillus sp. CECT 9249]|nr:hypothetical protein PAE9249_02778 [Paenibacillus sp. CECT 9249]